MPDLMNHALISSGWASEDERRRVFVLPGTRLALHDGMGKPFTGIFDAAS